MHRKKNKMDMELITISLAVLAIIISIFNVSLTQGISSPSAPPNPASGQAANNGTVVEKPLANVSITILADSSCASCANVSVLSDFLKQQLGVRVSGERTVEYNSAEGAALIARYNMTSVPSLIASPELSEYDQASQLWQGIGTVEADGMHVLRLEVPPYRSLADGRVKGLVTLVNLVDDSCAECYDVGLQRVPLTRLGVFVANESTYSVSSEQGKAYVRQYNVTSVPTILLSPEASVYSTLNDVWGSVGTVEGDGRYVFRNMDALGGVVYKDLETGKVVGLNATGNSTNSSG